MKEDYWGPLDAQKAGRKAEADKVWSVGSSKIQPAVSEGRSGAEEQVRLMSSYVGRSAASLIE